MKFEDKEALHMFLMDVNDMALVENTELSGFSPSERQMDIFIKKRKKLVPKLKNFRRQQASKQQWRTNRFKLKQGIRRFHKSTSGKRMHKAVGRFLATRDFSKGNFKREVYDYSDIKDVCETLKALSSIRTHNYIEFEYYHTLSDQVDYEIFSEELIPTIFRIEDGLTNSIEISGLDIDFLVRVCDEKIICGEISEVSGKSFATVYDLFQRLKDKIDESCPTSYLELLNRVKNECV